MKVIKNKKKEEYYERHANVLRMAGDVVRLKILCEIFKKDKVCVSGIAGGLGMSVARISHHLKLMEKNNLLVPVRYGKEICYSISDDTLAQDLKIFLCKNVINL